MKNNLIQLNPINNRVLYSRTPRKRHYQVQASNYRDAIMSAMESQITDVSIACWSVSVGVDQRKYQSSASLAFVGGNSRVISGSPQKWSVTRKMFPFDDVIMCPRLPYIQWWITPPCITSNTRRLISLSTYQSVTLQTELVLRCEKVPSWISR